MQRNPVRESVWDYPRPPAVAATTDHIVIEYGGGRIAESVRALRVLETSHPPVYYIPRADIRPGTLHPVDGSSWCEFKGRAAYSSVIGADGRRAERAAWEYPDPAVGYAVLRDHVAFYPSRMDQCLVDGEPVQPQDGDFYGGWITSRVVGPFKGGPGTLTW